MFILTTIGADEDLRFATRLFDKLGLRRMLDFIAIDFETANSFRGSPCSVGLVRVRGNQAVDARHWLIRPPQGVDQFDPWNTSIHGITADMVAEAPRWSEILPHIVDFIGDDVVVAHNAAFDTGVIRNACAVDQIEWPELNFLCSLVLARRVLSLPSYRLPFVAESLGYELNAHHDALADAHAVVQIIARLAAQHDAPDLESLAAQAGIRIGTMSGGLYRGSVATGSGRRVFTPVDVDAHADPEGYLFGRVVVFTGALMSMTRDAARQACAKAGATPEENTTKRTNVLVVGNINPAVLVPGSNLTGKTRRAFELQDSGQKIEVMTEDDFLRCLSGGTLDGVEVLLDPDRLDTGSSTRRTETSILEEQARTAEEPRVAKRPRVLRRTPVPTDQFCSIEGCGGAAAFKTRTKPTWCSAHIAEIQLEGGVRALEDFTHPNDWQLTECISCCVQAHYRFAYTLEKNKLAEATCRACFWRAWAAENRRMQGEWANWTLVPYEDARLFAEAHGFDYLGPLTVPSYGDDPHHTRCRQCRKINADRLSDIASGCTCQR